MFDSDAILQALPLLTQAAEMTILVSVIGLLIGFVIALGVASEIGRAHV